MVPSRFSWLRQSAVSSTPAKRQKANVSVPRAMKTICPRLTETALGPNVIKRYHRTNTPRASKKRSRNVAGRRAATRSSRSTMGKGVISGFGSLQGKGPIPKAIAQRGPTVEGEDDLKERRETRGADF